MNTFSYNSKEWHKVRSKTKARWKRLSLPCAYCGLALDWNNKPIVDHIQNRKQYPHLALVESNLQVVHHECNTKKAAYVENNINPIIGVDGLPDSWR